MTDEPIGYHRRKPPESKRQHKRFYSTARWRRLRLAKLAADPVCEYCRNAVATEVDHADEDNTNNAWANLRSACKPCHSAKTYRVQHDV